MEMIFKNTIDDFVDAYLLVVKKNILANISTYIFPRIGYPIICFGVIYHYFNIGDYATSVFLFFTYLFFQIFLYLKPHDRKLFYRKYKRICSKKPYLLMEKKLFIKNNNMYLKYDDFEKSFAIDKIKHIIISDQKIYLYTNFYFIISIIPVEIFEDKNKLDDFLNKISVNAEFEDNYKK